MVRCRVVLRAVSVVLVAGAGAGGDPGPAQAADVVVLGDSIGQGIAAANGLRNMAQRSFSLRRGNVARLLSQTPKRAVGIVSLGLNDAADPVWHLVKSIETAISAMQQSGRQIVWVGPPCVLKTWDARAEDLDIYLRERLATTAIQYVSLRDETICTPALRSRDGHHFTTNGYKYVWDKIRRDSSLAASADFDPCAHVAVTMARRRRGATRPGCGQQAAAH